jgi:hypothetical protein
MGLGKVNLKKERIQCLRHNKKYNIAMKDLSTYTRIGKIVGGIQHTIDTLGNKDLTGILIIKGKVNLIMCFQFDGL